MQVDESRESVTDVHGSDASSHNSRHGDISNEQVSQEKTDSPVANYDPPTPKVEIDAEKPKFASAPAAATHDEQAAIDAVGTENPPLAPGNTVPKTEPAPAPNAPKEKPSQAPQNSVSLMHSLRRSERIRNQAARAEEQRLIREERAAIEEAKARARSIAAKKAAATKRRAALEAEKRAIEASKARKTGAGTSPASSNSSRSAETSKASPKKIVKLKYLNLRPLPRFSAINLGNIPPSLFWLRLNIREFLFRFDKLCRLPLRLGTAINDPLQSYTPEQLKNVALSLLKLISNDTTPLHAGVRDYIAEIDNLDATNPNIWDWLLQFVEQLDAFAPQDVPTTEEEQLELLRRLMVICTGTETIRITVTSDVDQLKLVEKDSQDEIKGIQNKFKETESKLAKLKSVDKEIWSQKLAAARRSADNKIWKSQQQLYAKLHKYNMRSVPLFVDPAGNKYWSFQYKSASSSDWGSWIICEIIKRPTDICNWYKALAIDVTRVLTSRDELIAEKNNDRKQKRMEAKRATANSSPTSMDVSNHEENSALTENPESTHQNGSASNATADGKATPASAAVPNLTLKIGNPVKAEEKSDQKPKRKYPKVKMHPLQPLKDSELYYVEGRENIMELAHWLAGFPGIDPKAVIDIENMANYLAQDV